VQAAAIDIASAALKENETELKKTVIYAPISGIVLSRDMEPGQTMAASLEAPLLYTLAEDLRHMELQVDVDEADVGAVKDGQQAIFSVDAYPNRIFSATITQVRFGAEETDGVVTYKTVLKVENPDLLLRPGMTATANIIVQRDEKQLLVPNTALRFTPSQPPAIQPYKKSLLGRLMPGPPPHSAPKKNSGQAGAPNPPGGSEKPATVWVLKGMAA
jgi:HlyD family secretion protein